MMVQTKKETTNARKRKSRTPRRNLMQNKKRKNKNLPRRCVFCGGGSHQPGNRISEEHLWPEWMHAFLPKIPEATKWSMSESVSKEERQVIRTKPQQGHTYTLAFKVACKWCNEGWMSRLEAAIKPILIPMLEGRETILDRAQQESLAKWIVLKAIVMQHTDREELPVIEQEAVAAFRESSAIPENIWVWVAAHDSFKWYMGSLYRGSALTFDPTPPMAGRRKTIQTTAQGIGHIFALTFATTLNQVLDPAHPDVFRLWPPSVAELRWPLPNIDLFVLNSLANAVLDFERTFRPEWRSLKS